MPSNQQKPIPFAIQRIVFLTILMSVVIYAIVAAVMLAQNGDHGIAEEPNAKLDMIVVGIGVACSVLALSLRPRLLQRAEQAEGDARALARFQATMLPLAVLEGGSVLGITVWLLNGDPVPSLVVALVLLSLAIYLVPFRDPDAQGLG